MEKYRTFDVSIVELEHNRVLVFSGLSGKIKIIPLYAAQWLLSCDLFRELSQHATSYCNDNNIGSLRVKSNEQSVRGSLSRWALRMLEERNIELYSDPRKISNVQQGLEELARDGFLINDSLVKSILQKAHIAKGSNPKIESLCIPTNNQPRLLSRAISTQARDLCEFNRSVEFVVMDDSEEEFALKENVKIIRESESSFGLNIFYANRERRAEYANLLAEVSFVDSSITNFALVGDKKYETHGGPRNAHLLDSVGKMCLQVDDDIIGGVAHVPNVQQGLELGSPHDIHEYWYFSDEESSFDFVQPTNMDILTAHEEMLGKTVANCANDCFESGDDISLDYLSPKLLHAVEHGSARIAVSIAGTTGDSAMSNKNFFRLLLRRDSFQRLINSESEYKSNLTTRYLARSPLKKTIFESEFLMSTIIGFDCRDLVPPFMVPGRNMDGTFGKVVQGFINQYRVGYIPYVFRHSPYSIRKNANISEVVDPSEFRLNDLLIILLNSCQKIPGYIEISDILQHIGLYLMSVSALSVSDFEKRLKELVAGHVLDNINSIKQRLAEEHDPATYWISHMRLLVDNHYKYLSSDWFAVPVDVEGEPEYRFLTLKNLVGKYGELLYYWPLMVNGAKELRKSGTRVACRIK